MASALSPCAKIACFLGTVRSFLPSPIVARKVSGLNFNAGAGLIVIEYKPGVRRASSRNITWRLSLLLPAADRGAVQCVALRSRVRTLFRVWPRTSDSESPAWDLSLLSWPHD